MAEIGDFGAIVLAISGGVMLAVLARKFSERFPIPAPALFLVAAAAFPVVLPDIRTVERIGVVALIVILFDGGMAIGWRRFRRAAMPIASLGIVGTLVTAAVMAGFAHYLFDFDWTTAWILGAALAPTDPAVMFSILGDKEIRGRTGTILEGEAGVNDPVGIALMIGILEFATSDDGSLWSIVEEFVLEMTIGLVVGLAGTAVLVVFMRRVRLPSEGLYPLRTLAAAGIIYGLASVAHGSGFLAVFIAGLALERARHPVQAADPTVPYVDREPRRDRRLRRPRPDGERDRAVRGRGLARRIAARARAGLRRAPACARAAARSAQDAGRREGVHRLGRPEGSGADPARLVLHPRGRGRCSTAVRDRVRRRSLLRHRPGVERAVRRFTPGRAHALGGQVTALVLGLALLAGGSAGPPRSERLERVAAVRRGREAADDGQPERRRSPRPRDRQLPARPPRHVRLDVLRTDTLHPGRATKTIWSATRHFRAGRRQIVWHPARGTEPRTYVLRLRVGRRVYMNLPGKRRRAPVVRVQGIEAGFPKRSYAPGEEADLRISSDTASLRLQIFYYSSQVAPRGRDFRTAGTPMTNPVRIDWRGHRNGPGTLQFVRAGDWPCGLYFVRLTAADGRVGYTPFVVRRRVPQSRVAVVLSTNTWQAYNFWDGNGDGWGDSWYVSPATRSVDLGRPFLDFGVPYRFRDWDLDFIAWLNRTGKQVDFLSDDDLDGVRER